MKCPFCDSEFDVQSLIAADEAIAASAAQVPPYPDQSVSTGQEPDAPPPKADERVDWIMPSAQWSDEEQEGMVVYACETCGGAIASDQTTSMTSCPYCGNPIAITARFQGHLKPDLALPFQLAKADAKAALLNHYKGKPFLPRYFHEDNHIDEIKGVYVPYWLFDTILDADAVYDCTKVRRYSDSRYNYTETSHYKVNRTGSIEFKHLPVDGSARLADDLMESIEPFDYSQLAPFQTAYLAGYSANIYDVSAETALTRAHERILSTADEVVRTSVSGYDSVSKEQINASYRNSRCYYVLLPVWLLSTTFEGKVYTFAMNGQTGRLVGDLPVDKSLVRASFWKLAGIIAAITMALSMAFGWMGGY
jgi:DNA-directed RNA polymerase subunit RPC12/RpoP